MTIEEKLYSLDYGTIHIDYIKQQLNNQRLIALLTIVQEEICKEKKWLQQQVEDWTDAGF